MLKKRVLEKAVNEINDKTDIAVSYELEKKGRKVVAIFLSVTSKHENDLSHNTQETIEGKLKAF